MANTTSRTSRWQVPRVTLQPDTARGFQRGVNQVANAVAPTLGPLARAVVIEQIDRAQKPELLDDGAAIARRIHMVQGRAADVGAMYLRQMLARVQDQAGDGTATAAVLFQTIYNEGRRYIASGGNSMLLRRSLEHGAQVIGAELESMTLPLSGKPMLVGLANAVGHDSELAEALGGVFDRLGEHNQLNIHPGRGRGIECNFVEGHHWESVLLNRGLLPQIDAKFSLTNALILITDFEINEPQELIPLVELAGRNQLTEFFWIVGSLSEKVAALLAAPTTRERLRIAAVRSHGLTGATSRDELHDLALLTGGRALLSKAGYSLQSVRLEDFGRARLAWANKEFFGFRGGKGDTLAIRRQLDALKHAYQHWPLNGTESNRKRLVERLHRLVGDMADVWVGGLSVVDVERRTKLANRVSTVMRGAVDEGVVPGGGCALLNCRSRLRSLLEQAESDDERAAYRILIKAVETPFHTLVRNSGRSSELALAALDRSGTGVCYDVVRGSVVDLAHDGIFDPGSVVKTAATNAVRSAALALTIDAIVHRSNPPEERKP